MKAIVIGTENGHIDDGGNIKWVLITNNEIDEILRTFIDYDFFNQDKDKGIDGRIDAFELPEDHEEDAVQLLIKYGLQEVDPSKIETMNILKIGGKISGKSGQIYYNP